MNMMANAGPYGGPYGQSAGQGLPGAGLGPQLQNKAGLPNNMANQFSMDKKAPPGQGMPGMVGICFCSVLVDKLCSHHRIQINPNPKLNIRILSSHSLFYSICLFHFLVEWWVWWCSIMLLLSEAQIQQWTTQPFFFTFSVLTILTTSLKQV